MKFARLLMLILCMLILTVPGFAQDQESNENIPVVAILKFGDAPALNLAEQGILDALTAYGYVEGDNIQLIVEQAELDINIARDLVAFVLDRDVDVIATITTPVTITAVEATRDMENPPAIFFNTVTNPYAVGIADTSCFKPEHVTGSQTQTPYSSIFPVLLDIDPTIEMVGVLYNDAEANSVLSVEIIESVAEEMGIDVLVQSVANQNVVLPAAESLLMSGVDAIFVPTDSTVASVMLELSELAALASIPLVSASSVQVYNDATVGIGLDYYQEGLDTARLINSYLNGELDIARTAINAQTGVVSGINLDAAMQQNVELSTDFIATADFVIENGESTEDTPSVPEMTLEERMEADMAFLAELECTSERIAEEQATLDAQSE
ncbi:MAG: ABC transporter substrate-binding protein [Chloroflexota bacterium]